MTENTSVLLNSSFNFTWTGNTTDAADSSIRPWMIIDLNFYFFVIAFGALQRVAGCLINSLIPVLILKYKKLQTPSNVLVLSLALADILGLIPAPIEISTSVMWKNENTKWRYTCYVETFLGTLCLMGNVASIHLIAWERFISIHFAIWARNTFTVKFMAKVAGLQWLLLVALAGFVLIQGNVGVGNDLIFCAWSNMSTLYDVIVYLFGIISIGTLLLYLRLAYVTMKRFKSKRLTVGPMAIVNAQEKRRQDKSAKVTKMMLLVVGTYYGLYLPSVVTEYIDFDFSTSVVVSYAMYLIFMFNSICNPFIYFYASKEFNLSFKKMFGIKSAQLITVTTKSQGSSTNGSMRLKTVSSVA